MTIPGGVREMSAHLFSEAERAVLERYRVRRPDTWEVRRAALLVVDIVESFVGPDAPVEHAQDVCVTACGERAWRAIERVRPLLDSFRRRQAPVAFSTITSLPPAPGRPPRRTPTSLRPDVVVEELAPQAGELQIPKTRPSAFFGTPLVAWLTSRHVEQVVIVGGTTSGCVRATALDAYSYGFDVLIPEDGCFDRVTTSHVVTLTDMNTKYARVVQCAEVQAKLDAVGG